MRGPPRQWIDLPAWNQMNAIIIEHVRASELPEPWRTRLAVPPDACVTVRIEEEPEQKADSAFGIWSDRDEMSDVAAYVRKIRAPRFGRE
jgi:hypothetical protein